MPSSHRPSLRLIARALLSAGVALSLAKSAQADTTPSTPLSASDAWRSEQSAPVDLMRFDAIGIYLRGSRIVGYGTREPYQGVGVAARFHVVRFPTRRIGYEVKVDLGGNTVVSPPIHLVLDGAFDVAPLRWSGDVGGALVLGVGNGVEVSSQPSLDEAIRVYPLVLARLRLWPSRTLGLHAAWRFAPITSNALLTSFHEIEAAMSIGLVTFGAQVSVELTTGGDPERTYRALRLGPFLGVAGY